MPADQPPQNFEASPPRPRGRPGLAWCAILLLVAGVVVLQYLPRQRVGPNENALAGLTFDLQVRMMVGLSDLVRDVPGQRQQIYAQALQFNTGPPAQRLRFVPLAAELSDPETALELLDRWERDFPAAPAEGGPLEDQPSEDQLLAWRLLDSLYGDYAAGNWTAPSLSPEDRAWLETELGFAGRLALHPAEGPDAAARAALLGSASRLAVGFYGGIGGFACLGLLGLAGLIALLAFAGAGRLRSALAPPSDRGGIYAETFAVWLLLLLTISFAAGVVFPGSLLAGGLAMAISLLAVAYPLLRGVPWSEVRKDIGWTGGAGLRELPAGLAAYAMMLPLAGLGLIVTMLLLLLANAVSGSVQTPMHPIAPQVPGAEPWTMAVVLLVASAIAPLVEETMFRGFLYRHLRDATWGLGGAKSFVVSSLIGGLLFAAMHPQGMLAVPALTSIAVGLTVAREWRGTLLPSMIAHGIHNGVLMLLLFSIAG